MSLTTVFNQAAHELFDHHRGLHREGQQILQQMTSVAEAVDRAALLEQLQANFDARGVAMAQGVHNASPFPEEQQLIGLYIITQIDFSTEFFGDLYNQSEEEIHAFVERYQNIFNNALGHIGNFVQIRQEHSLVSVSYHRNMLELLSKTAIKIIIDQDANQLLRNLLHNVKRYNSDKILCDLFIGTPEEYSEFLCHFIEYNVKEIYGKGLSLIGEIDRAGNFDTHYEIYKPRLENLWIQLERGYLVAPTLIQEEELKKDLKKKLEEIRTDFGVQSGFFSDHPELTFSMTVFLCDDYLRFTPTIEQGEEKAKQTSAQRFFKIASKLPIELQMTLCNRASAKSEELIPSRASEAAFKCISEAFLTNEEIKYTGMMNNPDTARLMTYLFSFMPR